MDFHVAAQTVFPFRSEGAHVASVVFVLFFGRFGFHDAWHVGLGGPVRFGAPANTRLLRAPDHGKELPVVEGALVPLCLNLDFYYVAFGGLFQLVFHLLLAQTLRLHEDVAVVAIFYICFVHFYLFFRLTRVGVFSGCSSIRHFVLFISSLSSCFSYTTTIYRLYFYLFFINLVY